MANWNPDAAERAFAARIVRDWPSDVPTYAELMANPDLLRRLHLRELDGPPPRSPWSPYPEPPPGPIIPPGAS